MTSSSATSPPSALEQALAKIIAGKQREWQREKDLLVAESRAIVAELRNEIAGLHAQLKEFTAVQVARIDARLAEVRDGEDGKSVERVDVETMVRAAVAEIPRPKDGEDGKSVSAEDLAPLIAAEVARAVAALPAPKDGRDADPEVVKALVAEQVAAVVATIPAPRDGEDGKDADPALIGAMIDEAVAALPKARDGESVTAADVAPLIAEEVAKAVAALPRPKDGDDGKSIDPEDVRVMLSGLVDAAIAALPPAPAGKDADPEVIRSMVAAAVAALPAPKDGRSVTLDEVRPVIVEEVARAVAALPAPTPGKDGVGLAGALIDRAGNLVITLTDGATRNLGPVVGKDADQDALLAFLRDAVAALPRPRDGEDGKDGLGFDDLTVEHDGVRGFTLRFARGTESKEFAFSVPVMIYRGVFREGDAYQRGDTVTWGGSLWHANEATAEKPGDGSKTWTLAAKRGRDGKEVVTTKHVAPVKTT